MKWSLRKYDEELEKQYLDKGVNRLIARLLTQRNVQIKDAKVFLKTPYDSLSEPFSLPNIGKATDVFCWAVENNKTLAVMGDYDCDGIISSSMIHYLCQSLNVSCEIFLPHRIQHGYGFSKKTLTSFQERMVDPPNVVFVLDCGSNNKEEVDILKDWGVEKVVIIDHHIVDEFRAAHNADAFVNWHLGDNQEMCTCGEVYQFIRCVNRRISTVNPIEYLTFAAIGTIADSSPLVGDNRIIVKHGLSHYATSHVTSFGFASLLGISKIDGEDLLQEEVSFKIAPIINASGRMASPDIAYRLLTEKDSATADLMAENLVDLNRERKKLQKKITDQAIEMVKGNRSAHKHGILLYNNDWHIGIVGIVASKMVDMFGKPSIIIGRNGAAYKGSGRTVPHINIKSILDNIGKKLFTEYGGHANAVGVALKPEIVEDNKLDFANQVFNTECEKYNSSKGIGEPTKLYDADLKISSVNLDIARKIKKFIYPYSEDNPEPIFKLSNVIAHNVNVREGDGWTLIKFNVKKNEDSVTLPFKQFNPVDIDDLEGHRVNIYFQFPQNLDSPWTDLNVIKIEKP